MSRSEKNHRTTSQDDTAAGGLAAAAGLLTSREKTGKKRPPPPLVDLIEEGQTVLIARRQGGPFDPAGVRRHDVMAADNIVAIVDEHPGRWVMVTLTVDRSEWIGPEAAYQRCNERVREVARLVSRHRVHLVTFEVQTKTGEGWPHWHLIVWCPDDRSIEEIRECVVKAWRTANDVIDEETGEVLGRSYQKIGIVDVQQAAEREGIARYVAKYVVKPWAAVPPWMGNSKRQLRKYRLSRGCFEWLERRGRHKPKRGARVHRPVKRRRRSRCLYQRMASSEAAHAVFVKREGKLAWVSDVPLPAADASVIFDSGCMNLRFVGKRCAFVVSDEQLQAVKREAVAGGCARQSKYLRERVRGLRMAWDSHQRTRAME